MAHPKLLLLFLLAAAASTLHIQTADAFAIRLNFSPEPITVFCPVTRAEPSTYPLPPGPFVDYHTVLGLYDGATLRALQNHSMLLTPLNHRRIELTKDEHGRSSINGVKVSLLDAYKVEDKAVFHLLEYSLDPRTGPRVLPWERPTARPLPRDAQDDLKSLRAFDTACSLVLEILWLQI